MIDPNEIKVLWFGTLRAGLYSQPPPVVIESVKVDNNDVEFGNVGAEPNYDESKIQNLKSRLSLRSKISR